MRQKAGQMLTKLTRAIQRSYGRDERTHRIGHTFLPFREKIVALLAEIRCLIFPGYFGHQELGADTLAVHVQRLVAEIRENLEEQIYACVCTERQCPRCAKPERCRKDARRMTDRFLERIPHVRDMLALDAQAAYDGDPAAKSIDEIIYCYPGFYAVTVYRIAHELLKVGVPLMPRIMTEHAHSVTGTDIHPGARIGKSFFIDHATGVVVGETTRIGNNVKVYQGVTLGARSFPKDERGKVIKGLQRHPTIEDNVTIYPNATILGGKTVIGRGVTVGGNVYVVESVPPHSIVKQESLKLQVIRKKSKRRR